MFTDKSLKKAEDKRFSPYLRTVWYGQQHVHSICSLSCTECNCVHRIVSIVGEIPDAVVQALKPYS